jgi:Plasmid pRiA4b ORF-3-like protein
MTPRFSLVHQFRIELAGSRPPIWRRIQVPAWYTFWDLHVAIQDAMGWKDYRLHEFTLLDDEVEDLRIGIPDDEALDVLAGWQIPITHFFGKLRTRLRYTYDFGDDWEHDLVYEGRLRRSPGITYPLCLEGARACPPEDCGGLPDYERLLRILADPLHDEHEDTRAWVGASFDAERFEAEAVLFDDPRGRWTIAFQGDEPPGSQEISGPVMSM